MEKISKIMAAPLPSSELQTTQRSSPSTLLRQSLGLSREKLTAMLDVLKARWQTRGWHAMSREDSEPMAIEFIRELDRHEIPWQHYRELYQRSLDLRARRIAQGLAADDFSADMMVACWPSLRQDLHEREVAAGRTLTAQAQTQCLDCFGTGTQIIRDAEGNKIGARPGCKHEAQAREVEETMDGFAMAEAALRQPAREETALDICRRVRRDLAKDYLADVEGAWEAQTTWLHAERYVRENPE
jgi:hypothetical protein